MSNTPYFSIIVPMYNVERYIKICVDSILQQTFQDFELLIVDDASTDNSYKICQELFGGNEKVHLFRHEKNHGTPSFARNFGLENASGKYVWFVDNDDVILPDALEKLGRITQSTIGGGGVDVVHLLGHYRTYQDDDNPIKISESTLTMQNFPQGFLGNDILERIEDNWLNRTIDPSTWLYIYKRNFLFQHKLRFPDCRAEDVPIAFAGICFAERYFMLRDSLYIWRQHSKSLTHSKNIKQLCNSIASLPILFNVMEEIMAKLSVMKNNRWMKEQCIVKIWEMLFDAHFRSFYDGRNVPLEVDNVVYETMLPIFGENTALVKYFFHGFNTMWRRTNVLNQQVNFLLQHLRQREEELQKQNQLIEQVRSLLEQNNAKN